MPTIFQDDVSSPETVSNMFKFDGVNGIVTDVCHHEGRTVIGKPDAVDTTPTALDDFAKAIRDMKPKDEQEPHLIMVIHLPSTSGDLEPILDGMVRAITCLTSTSNRWEVRIACAQETFFTDLPNDHPLELCPNALIIEPDEDPAATTKWMIAARHNVDSIILPFPVDPEGVRELLEIDQRIQTYGREQIYWAQTSIRTANRIVDLESNADIIVTGAHIVAGHAARSSAETP